MHTLPVSCRALLPLCLSYVNLIGGGASPQVAEFTRTLPFATFRGKHDAAAQHFLESHALDVGRNPTVYTAAHQFRRIVYENKDKLSAGIICAGEQQQ